MNGGRRDTCLVSYVKWEGGWIKSGIPLKTDVSIAAQVKKEFTSWQNIDKSKSKNSTAAEEERIKYKEKVLKTFDVSDRNAEEIINKDKKRDQKQKYEDIVFIKDIRGPRKTSIGGEDTKFKKTIEKKLEREEKARVREE